MNEQWAGSDSRPPGSAVMSTARQSRWRGYAWAVAAAAAATAAGWPLYHGLRPPDESHRPAWANTNVLMLYMLAVLWTATRCGRGPAAVTAVLGVAAFDFCFVPPYLRFVVHDRQYVVTFAVMLLTALTISTLTHRVRRQSEAARRAWSRAEAESLRSTLLSGLSHDLRTPLAAITGAASTLIEGGERLPPAARREMLDTVYGEAERMERLISNLLDMTRLESGGLALAKEWQPLAEVVGAALHHLRHRLRGRAVTTDLPADLPLVHIDGVAVGQVLINLIDNALEYTPPHAPIELAARAGDDGTVAVEVSDRGPGLPPGAEERVFDKFFRAGRGAGGRGVGLGLAIARGVVEAHGGRIAATNRPNGGACFRFTLPRAGPAPATAPAALD